MSDLRTFPRPSAVRARLDRVAIVAATWATITGLAACAGDTTDSTARPRVLGAAVPVPDSAEAVSLLGDALYRPELPDDVLAVYAERYEEAEDALAESPEDVDALIWMGRRTAYLGFHRDAIDIYTHAMTLHPDDARLYRHRGHRYVTVRELDNAIADFERAVELIADRPDEVEPDGLPNRLGVPTSTLHFNIWYHLGLAHYLKGDLEAALEAYRSCLAASVHPDSVVATSYWLYMTLRRLGMDGEAAAVLESIHADMDIIESTGYLDLLLLHKGERTLEDVIGPAGADATLQSTTTSYGLGVWQLLDGREDEARATFERTRTGLSQWAAFGFIAAEAELARWEER
jgi:tetratricopeptide (TPR) repeat protein